MKLLCDWNDGKDFTEVAMKTCVYVCGKYVAYTSPDRVDTMPPHMNKSAVHSASFERLFRLVASVPLRKNKLKHKKSVCREDYI